MLRYNVQRGVAVAPSVRLPAVELAGVLSFRVGYEDKVHLDTMATGHRVLQPAAGCRFADDD